MAHMNKRVLSRVVTEHRRSEMLPVYDVILQSCDYICRKPGNLYIMYSQKHTGINRHSGKRYFRWENMTLQGLRLNHNGNIVAYTRVGKKNTSPQAVWTMLDEPRRASWDLNTKHSTFRNNAREMFGIESWHDVYPVAKHYNVPQYHMVPPTILGAMRAKSSREFVERLFGKRHYRRDLLKAVGNSETIYPLHIAQAFRGLVPTDWIVNFLRLNHTIETNYELGYGITVSQDIRSMLTQMDPRTYRYLLNDRLTTNTLYMLEDVARNGLYNEDNYYRSWQNVHDRNMPRYHHINHTPFQDCEINLHPIAEKVHGVKTKSFEIKTALHTAELTEWGSQMHNCIGGYRNMAVNKQTILGAIYAGEKLVANFEIAPNGNLKQLLGTCNKPLPKSQRAELEAAFRWKGVKVQGYWGANDNIY